jgi:acetoin utilization deacetylase AcuC-like enzyme
LIGVLIYTTDPFFLPLPAGHRFPMREYALLRERVASFIPDRIRIAEPATDDELACAYDPAYVAAVDAGALDLLARRRIGFPWSRAMAARSRRSAGATLAACRGFVAFKV